MGSAGNTTMPVPVGTVFVQTDQTPGSAADMMWRFNVARPTVDSVQHLIGILVGSDRGGADAPTGGVSGVIRFSFDANDRPHVEACEALVADFLRNQDHLTLATDVGGEPTQWVDAPLDLIGGLVPVRLVRSGRDWTAYLLRVRRFDYEDTYLQGSHLANLVFTIQAVRYSSHDSIFGELTRYAEATFGRRVPPYTMPATGFDNILTIYGDAADGKAVFVQPISISNQWSVDHSVVV
jgi:hypothetical protein